MDVSSDITMKTAFKNLQEQQYILNNVKVVNKALMSIHLNTKKLERGNWFTQLPKSLFTKLNKIGHRGIRLLYCYESHINRNDRNKPSSKFTFVAFETITKETGIGKDAIDKYNKLLVKEKLLHIEKHKAEYTGEYTDDDRQVWTKYNNHYDVNLWNIYEL
jgi:hypothetical protein